MQALRISKFGFRIRTRGGAVVDNLMIHGETEDDARRKLTQMYRDCSVLSSWSESSSLMTSNTSFEEVIDLINR